MINLEKFWTFDSMVSTNFGPSTKSLHIEEKNSPHGKHAVDYLSRSFADTCSEAFPDWIIL